MKYFKMMNIWTLKWWIYECFDKKDRYEKIILELNFPNNLFKFVR